MATPKEKLLSLGNLTSANIGTFTNEHQQCLKKRSVTFQSVSSLQRHQQLKVMQLQQHWQELKERELAAQHCNRQLLQEFEEAQDMLSVMMIRTADMKTIRLEYEHYLEDRAPSWQQQLKEKTRAAQRIRMEEYMNMCVKNTEEQKTKPSAEQPSLSNGPTKKTQKVFTSQGCNGFSNSSQNSYLSSMHSSWLTQTGRSTNQFPAQVHSDYHSTSQILQSLPSTAHQCYSPRQYTLARASILADFPCSWLPGAVGMPSEYEALRSYVHMEESPPERSEAQATAEEMHRTLSSVSEKGSESRRSPFCQGLDVKPVRLSGEAAENSESGRDSGQFRGEKKREGGQCSPLECEICPLQESRASSPIVINSNTLGKTSKKNSLSEKGGNARRGMRRKIGKQPTVLPKKENGTKGVTRNEWDDRQNHNSTSDESEISSVKCKGVNVKRRPSRKSASCKATRCQVEKSRSMQSNDDVEEQQSSGSEEKGLGEDGEGKGHSIGDEEQLNSQRHEKQKDSDVKDDPSSSSSEKEEEIAAAVVKYESKKEKEDELSDKMRNENSDRGKKDSAASQSEEMYEDESGGSQDELESGMDYDRTEPEDGDSNSIISPQENRHKKINAIPEVQEDLKEGTETEASEEESDESGDEDIEQLLAPQARMTRIEKNSTDEKPKAFNMDIFQVEPDRALDKDPSDSDEFDHFYD